jgi:hypothetical protein
MKSLTFCDGFRIEEFYLLGCYPHEAGRDLLSVGFLLDFYHEYGGIKLLQSVIEFK